VSTVLIYAMLNSPAALSNINTSAFPRDAVNARCSQSYGFFEGWQVAGYLPVGKADTLILCLANILLRRPKVVCVYGRYAVGMGLSSFLVVGIVGLMARLIFCGL